MNKDVIERFEKGQVGIFPTDTAYGIGCRMDNVNSVKCIYKIRKRPNEKALIVLVSSIEMAKSYVEIDNEVEEKLIKKYWPGGLTIVLKCKKEKVPSIVRANGDTLAVRLPDHTELRGIIEELGVPIVAPSANIAGEKTPFSLADVDPLLLDQVDFTLNGMCTINGVSTIVDTTITPWKTLRNGVVNVSGSY